MAVSNRSNLLKVLACALVVGFVAASLAMAEGGLGRLIRRAVEKAVEKVVESSDEESSDEAMDESSDDAEDPSSTQPTSAVAGETPPDPDEEAMSKSEDEPDDEPSPATEPQAGSQRAPVRAAWPVKSITPSVMIGDPSFRHDSTVTHVQVLADNKRLVSSGNDGTARLWDLQTGKQLQVFPHKGSYVWDCAVLADQERMVTSGAEGKIIVWDLKSAKRLQEFKQGGMVFRLALDKASTRVAGSDQGSGAGLWDIKEGKKIISCPGKKNDGYTILFDKDEKNLIVGWNDSTIRAWNLETKECKFLKNKDKPDQPAKGKLAAALQKEDPDKTGNIYTLAPSPDRTKALVCCSARGPWVMDLADGKEVWRSKDVPKGYCGSWSADGKSIAFSGEDELFCLDPADGAKRWSVKLADSESYTVVFHPDSQSIFIGQGQLIARYSAVDGKRIYPEPDAPLQNKAVKCVAAMPGGEGFLSCSGENGLRVWDRKTAKIKAVWLGDQQVNSVAVSADGRRVIAAGDKMLIQLDGETGKSIRQWQDDGHSDIGMSADGKLAFAGGRYSDLTVYDSETGEALRKFTADRNPGEYNPIQDWAAGPEMQLVTCADKGVKVWSSSSGELVQDIDSNLRGVGFVGGMLIGWSNNSLSLWRPVVEEGKALGEEDARKLIDKLSSDDYKTREDATTRLKEAGRSILPLLKQVKAADLETRQRLTKIQEEMAKGIQYKHSQTLSLPKSDSAILAVHPDGKHFVLARGAARELRMLLCEIGEKELKVLCQIDVPHAAAKMCFDDTGALIVGNCNGTVCIYENLLKSAEI